MISVFSGFILSGQALTKFTGFALAIAVLFDAFIVRMTVVPAVMALLGRAAWWLPRWFNLALPSVEIEGAKLHHLPRPAQPRRAATPAAPARPGPAGPA